MSNHQPRHTRRTRLGRARTAESAPPTHVRITRRRALRGFAMTMAGVVAFGAAGVGASASRLTGNLVSVDLDRLMIHERPTIVTASEIAAHNGGAVELIETGNLVIAGSSLPDAAAPGLSDSQPLATLPPDAAPATIPLAPVRSAGVNILVMGTDGRGGENLALGGGDSTGMRADSTILLHISADHQWVTAVSIPRDTIVNIPACPTTSGKYIAGHPLTRFNAAFAYGAMAGKDIASGALCTLTTVEQITGIRMDGFVALDFAGFKGMVDALGGVEVDVPTKIHSPLAGDLKLDAGTQTLDGWQALQYARARTGLGLAGGSDLNRIKRQQQIMGAIAHQVQATNLLTDSPTLFRFLDATTSNMTTSSNYASINGLVDLASTLSSVNPTEIQFITAPIATNPENPNTVILTSKARTLWENIKYDQRPESS